MKTYLPSNHAKMSNTLSLFPAPTFHSACKVISGSSPLCTGQTTWECEGAVAAHPGPALETPLAAAKFSPEDSVSLQPAFRDLDGIFILFKGDQKKSPLDPNTPEPLSSIDLALPSALVLQAGDTIHLWATPRVVLVLYTAFHMCLDSDIKRDFNSSESQRVGALGRYRGQPRAEAPGHSALLRMEIWLSSRPLASSRWKIEIGHPLVPSCPLEQGGWQGLVSDGPGSPQSWAHWSP